MWLDKAIVNKMLFLHDKDKLVYHVLRCRIWAGFVGVFFLLSLFCIVIWVFHIFLNFFFFALLRLKQQFDVLLKVKTTKSDRVNGWYPVSSPGQRMETRSPLSWKDILENSYHMEDYSEYARVPKGNTGFLPSRKHRKVADAEVFQMYYVNCSEYPNILTSVHK